MALPSFHKQRLKSLLCGCAVSLCAPQFATAAETASDVIAPILLDLPAQSLDRDIRDIALRANITISFSRRALKKIERNALRGSYSVAKSLAVLLQGTEYSFEFVNASTVRIFKIRKHRKKRNKAPGPLQKLKPLPAILPRDEIIITANKRKRFDLLQSAPYSASVVSGETLSLLGIVKTQSLSLYIPGIEMTNLGSSRNKMSIRGISDGVFNGRTQSTVGVYFNDTPINFNAPFPDIPLLDVKSLEVLRGPQGSLYGTGAIGGIYKITTNKPDTRNVDGWIESALSSTRHGGTNSELSAMVNLPIIQDKVAVRGVGYLLRNSGYIDDTRLGLTDVNKTEIKGGRANLAWQLSSDWQMSIGIGFQDVETDDTQYRLANLPGLARQNYLREPHGDDFIHTHINIVGDLEWGHIKSSTSRVARDIHDLFDASLSLPDNVSRPVQSASFAENRKIDFISHETVLDFDFSDNVNLLVGGFISHTKNDYQSDYGIVASGAQPRETLFSEVRDDSTLHYGVFGEADAHLTDKLLLGLGIRWFDEHLTTSTIVTDIGKAPATIRGEKKDSDILPRISLGYQFTDDSFVYGLVSVGYRVGGLNTGSILNSFAPVTTEQDSDNDEARLSVFESDVITMYEIGEKTRWFDDRLVFNASAFLVDWKNIQTDHILENGFSSVLNAGDAINLGYDFELVWKPNENFVFQANATINNPDVTNINPVFSGVVTDQHLPRIPDFAGSIILSYKRRIPNTLWQSTWTVDYAYTGVSQLSFAPTDALLQGENHVLNARVSFSDGNWQIEGFVQNIFDDQSNTFAFGNPFTFRKQKHSTPQRPRTIGVRMRRNF
ncbi:MAG: hypothetical protein COA47_11405 [Robiginitomaculum sp.]|nr:MAG: hypothetical protein COA47_11405 [Robiginitomaculum sp.]